jgi:protein involved in sex pheromone biosynthesis
MKKLIPAITAALLLLCVCLAFSNQNKRKGETVLSIKDSETRYTFKASFYSEITPEVTEYMDSCANILRTENANFRIKISDGDLSITAEKQVNSAVAMARIRNMCKGISDVLIQH